MNAFNEVNALLESEEPIAKNWVIRLMREGDLETKAALYVLTDEAWSRIQPELSMSEQCHFMASYLLECLDKNLTSDDYIYSGFEAAWEIAGWLKHLETIPGSESVIKDVAEHLKRLYLRSDEETRTRIVTGALEHVFEREALLPFFTSWKDDSELKEAFEAALEWGEAHRGKLEF